MANIELLKNRFQQLQAATPGADLFQIFAVMIDQEQERYAVALRTIEQYSAAIAGQKATISKLQAELDKLRSEQNQK
jgi:cell division protein FtsB